MALEPTKLADVIPTDDTERVFKDLVTFSKRPKRVIHEFPNLLWLIFNISRRWKNKAQFNYFANKYRFTETGRQHYSAH